MRRWVGPHFFIKHRVGAVKSCQTCFVSCFFLRFFFVIFLYTNNNCQRLADTFYVKITPAWGFVDFSSFSSIQFFSLFFQLGKMSQKCASRMSQIRRVLQPVGCAYRGVPKSEFCVSAPRRSPFFRQKEKKIFLFDLRKNRVIQKRRNFEWPKF